jgi:hypothetical protein
VLQSLVDIDLDTLSDQTKLVEITDLNPCGTLPNLEVRECGINSLLFKTYSFSIMAYMAKCFHGRVVVGAPLSLGAYLEPSEGVLNAPVLKTGEMPDRQSLYTQLAFLCYRGNAGRFKRCMESSTQNHGSDESLRRQISSLPSIRACHVMNHSPEACTFFAPIVTHLIAFADYGLCQDHHCRLLRCHKRLLTSICLQYCPDCAIFCPIHRFRRTSSR